MNTFSYTFGRTQTTWILRVLLIFVCVFLSVCAVFIGDIWAIVLMIFFSIWVIVFICWQYSVEYKMEKNNPQNAFPKKTEIIFSDTKISFTYVDKDKFTLCTIPYVDVLKRTLTSKLNIFGRKYRLRDSTEYYIFTNHTRKDYGGISAEKHFVFDGEGFDNEESYRSFMKILEEKTRREDSVY